MKVYVVMHNDYSNTHIVDVFAHEQDAIDACGEYDSVDVMEVYESKDQWDAVQEDELRRAALAREQARVRQEQERKRQLARDARLVKREQRIGPIHQMTDEQIMLSLARNQQIAEEFRLRYGAGEEHASG